MLMKLLKTTLDYEIWNLWNSCEKSVASKFQGGWKAAVFSLTWGALRRSLREETLQAGARGRWTCEARQIWHVGTVVDIFAICHAWGVSASSKCGCGPMSCVLAFLQTFHSSSILRGRFSGKKVQIYIMALLTGGVDLDGFGCFWLDSQWTV